MIKSAYKEHNYLTCCFEPVNCKIAVNRAKFFAKFYRQIFRCRVHTNYIVEYNA